MKKILLSFTFFLDHISMLHRMENMQFFLKDCKFKDLGSFKVWPKRAAGNLKVRTIKVNITSFRSMEHFLQTKIGFSDHCKQNDCIKITMHTQKSEFKN
jgi:hypothetical protein